MAPFAQVHLADGDEDGRLRNGVGVEVVKLHAIVMRECPHELVRRHAKATLVEGHEAHDVAIAWPRLLLAHQSNPLWTGGVGNRVEEAVIDERLQHLHGHVGRSTRIRLNDNSATAHECGGNVATAVRLAPSLSSSPFSLLLPGALCS